MLVPYSVHTLEQGPTLFLLRLALPASDQLEAFFSASCSELRLQRAGRYRQHDDRTRCLAAGWLVRQATEQLLEKTGCNELHDAMGRPWLPEAPDYSLSITHAGNWVACALYPDGPLGIDLEAQPEIAPGMAETFMSGYELHEYQAQADPCQRRDYFLRCWCLKECWLKAIGTGMLQNPCDASITAGATMMSVQHNRCELWHINQQLLNDRSLLAVCWQKSSERQTFSTPLDRQVNQNSSGKSCTAR